MLGKSAMHQPHRPQMPFNFTVIAHSKHQYNEMQFGIQPDNANSRKMHTVEIVYKDKAMYRLNSKPVW